MLIDDSKFLRSALEKTLAAKGFEVQVAADGEEGLRLAQQGGKFDLILLDLFLPKMTGHEVLKHLKADPATDTIPVLVLSGLAKEKEREQLMNSGAAECLPKALDLMTVVASVERLLRHESATP